MACTHSTHLSPWHGPKSSALPLLPPFPPYLPASHQSLSNKSCHSESDRQTDRQTDRQVTSVCLGRARSAT